MKYAKFVLAALLLALLIYLIYWLINRNHQDEHLVLYGNVDVRQVDIGFRVAGQVEALYFEEGDEVKKGDLLAKLDPTPYMSQVNQSHANLGSIRANLENAEKLVSRREQVVGISGVSKQDLDNAISNRDALKANLESAEAAYAISKENYSYTTIFAPTDGVILTRVREPGTVVNPADPVFILSVSSPLWIRAYVTETQLGSIYFGMPAQVTIDTPNAPIYQGKIGFISPIAEFTPKTVQTTQLRTDLVYRLRIYIDQPDAMLKQGMPVTITLPLKQNV